MKRWIALPLLLGFLNSCAAPPPTAQPMNLVDATPVPAAEMAAETAALRNDVTFLASDALEGRGVGLAGLDRAADFIAHRYADLHLRTLAGVHGYFQPFPFTLSSTVGPRTKLALDGHALALSREFTPVPITAAGSFSAPAVFVGYGIDDAQRHYDDYAGVDVHGKVAVAMRYEPHNAQGQSRFTNSIDWSADTNLMSKAQTAAQHGAVALLLVNPPLHHGIDLLLAPTLPRAPHASIPVLQISDAAIKPWIDLQDRQATIDATGNPDSQTIKKLSVAATMDLIVKQAMVKNVLAVLPGFGPHSDEYVLVGAHYDHLGRGGFGSLMFGSHAIHHGADDNASGTAAVLALASRLVRGGRLQRSIIFANFTAEEEGLIGSRYFVEHPPVPLSSIVAMINLDMVGRVRGGVLFVGGTGTASDFDRLLSAADAGLPLELRDSGPYIGRGGFGPSDHMSFAEKDIPVLFLFSGMHADYHRPTDTAEKINYAGIESVVMLSHRLLIELAAAPREPYDGQYDSQSAFASLIGGSGGRHAALGVVPDSSETTGETNGRRMAPGVRISAIDPGSAADKAGLRTDDVLQRVDDTRLNSIYDLQQFLSVTKPGTRVSLLYRRDGLDHETSATLGEARD